MSQIPFPLPAVYAGLEPAEVWRHFAALNAIPRPSGQEGRVRRYIQELAEAHQAMWKTDARGNIVVRVLPRNAGEDAPIIVLQSHLDMVCQRRPEVVHDFEKDPIVARRHGDQIFASGTTLGADNGIGAALALAILTSEGLTHGPLELLFTVGEETGLYGAANLDPELIRGRMLINLDSEDPKEITIGCAGGAGTTIFLPLDKEETPPAFLVRHVTIGGLQGGHSGIQIHEPLANSIKLLTAVLRTAREAIPELRLCKMQGGTAHNAIPRDAEAIIAIPAAALDEFQTLVSHHEVIGVWRKDEPGLSIETGPSETEAVLTPASTSAALELLHDLPHGVHRLSERFAGKVETSSNLAEVQSGDTEMEMHVSSRSFLASELKAAQQRVAEAAAKAGARIEVRDGYPGWEPRDDSPLLQATMDAVIQEEGQLPAVEVVHAGLECGILCERLPGLDAVSFGPLIRGAHTPEEWVSISSTIRTWKLLLTLLDMLARKGRRSSAD